MDGYFYTDDCQIYQPIANINETKTKVLALLYDIKTRIRESKLKLNESKTEIITRAEEPGRLARRETQEGAEAVVSQPPAVSEVSVAVPPAEGGAVFIVTSVCCAGSCQVLFCACQDSLPWEWFAGVAAPSAGSGFSSALRLCQLVQSQLVLQLRGLLELVILLLPAAVPGVPGPMQRQVDSHSRGHQCRSSSGGFDWLEVSQVAVSFACAFFSSSRKYYRSSSVFRGYGSGFLPPTSSRSFIGGASAWFCPLLRLTAVSLACGLAFAVFCDSGGFPRGY